MRVSGILFWFCLAGAGVLLILLAQQVNQNKSPVTPNGQSTVAQGSKGQGTSHRPDATGTAKGEGRSAQGAPPEPSATASKKGIAAPPDSPPPGPPTRPVIWEAGNNRPVPNAVVSLGEKGEKEWLEVMGRRVYRSSPRVLWQTVTGTDGGFAWPAALPHPRAKAAQSDDNDGRTLILAVRAEGYTPFRQPAGYPRDDPLAPILLARGGSIVAMGLGAPGIPVVAASPAGALRLRETNAQGETHFTGLEPGTYAVMIGDPHSTSVVRNLAADSSAKPRYTHRVSAGRETRVDLGPIREALAEVRGRATEAGDGDIILRSRAETPYLLRTHTLGPDGTFHFRFVPTGDYELVLTPALGAAHVVEIHLERGEREIEFAYPLKNINGVVLHAGPSTGGKKSEVPAADLEVRLTPDHGSGELVTSTDDQGGFAFKGLPPGSYYNVTVTGKDGGQPPVSERVLVRATVPTKQVRIRYPRPPE